MQQERDVNRDAALAHDDIAASAQRAQPAADELNGRQVPAQQGSAQDDYIAAPQQCGSPAPPAQNADIAAPYRVSRSMMQGTPEQRRPVTQADLDEINAGLAREGIQPVQQPAPRTPLRSGEKPAIKQEAEESLKFLDDFLAPRSVTWLRSRSAKTVRLKSRAAIFRQTIAQDSRGSSLSTKPPGTTCTLP